MCPSVVLFIGLRYMRGRNVDGFTRFVSWLSAMGMMLGVMALVSVLSVMNGFQNKLEHQILELIPQVQITTKKGMFDPTVISADKFTHLSGIKKISPLVTGNIVLQSVHGISLGVILGVEPTQTDPLSKFLKNTSLERLKTKSYKVILGQQLANQLGVKIGDKIRILVPTVNQFTPLGPLPNQRIFTVAGTFFSNSDVDQYELLSNIEDASRIMGYPSGWISSWRLFLHKPLEVNMLEKHPLPKGLFWKDWRDSRGQLFQAVQMEKNMMGLLLSLIIGVAVFNIATSICMTIIEKKGEVAILQTQGMTPKKIMAIFIIQGTGSAIIGSMLGAFIGILFINRINMLIPTIGKMLAGGKLPVLIDFNQIILIVFITIFLSIISTLYPSWYATTISPVKALRYE